MPTTPTQYDPSILEQFADQLNMQADSVVHSTTLRYGFTTFVAMLLLCLPAMLKGEPDMMIIGMYTVIVIVSTLFGVRAGVDTGKKKAFALKLQAQQILCQCRIELLLLKAIEPQA